MLENLITDRTASDVANGTKKGYYNAEDLNRVSDAMEYLVSELQRYGYGVPRYVKGPVWTQDDIPTVPQMEQYRQNVAAVRSVLEVLNTTPETPNSMEKLTYQKANDLEKILVDVETVIERIVKGMARSDCFTFWSGYRAIPCAASNKGRTWAELDAMNVTWENLENVDWYLLAYGNLGVSQ